MIMKDIKIMNKLNKTIEKIFYKKKKKILYKSMMHV